MSLTYLLLLVCFVGIVPTTKTMEDESSEEGTWIRYAKYQNYTRPLQHFSAGLVYANFFGLSVFHQKLPENRALFKALDTNDITYIEELIENGFDVNDCISDGEYDWPLLYHAVNRSNDTIVQFLLEAGANVNKPAGIDGVVPLDIVEVDHDTASTYAKYKLLLRAGACPKFNWIYVKSFLTIKILAGILWGNEEAVRYVSYVTDFDPTIKAIIAGDSSKVKKLLASNLLPIKKIINKKDDLDGTYLMYAALLRQIEIVKLLLERGANPLLKSMNDKDIFVLINDARDKILTDAKAHDSEITAAEQSKLKKIVDDYKEILTLCAKEVDDRFLRRIAQCFNCEPLPFDIVLHILNMPTKGISDYRFPSKKIVVYQRYQAFHAMLARAYRLALHLNMSKSS
jgi:ankyrin repeat protein